MLPWWGTLLMALGPSVLNMIAGGNKGENDQYTQTTEETPRGYQSPSIGMLDPILTDLLLRNYQNYGGAGMPGGGNLPGYFGDIFNMLGGDVKGLLEEYKKGGTKKEKRYNLKKTGQA